MAFIWKALIYSGGRSGVRIASYVFVVILAVSAAAMFLYPSGHAALIVCVLGIGGFLFSLLANIGSGAAYLRQDLPAMDLLQSLPVRGWKIVFGQLFTQAAMGAVLQWAALILVAVGVQGLPDPFMEHLDEFHAVAIGLAILALPLNLTMMIVPAGALLLWPGWFRGGLPGVAIEAAGLRIILLLGQLLAVAVALIPPAVAAAAVAWLARSMAGGELFWVPGAAVAAAVVLAAEAWLGILALGAIFERYDVTAE